MQLTDAPMGSFLARNANAVIAAAALLTALLAIPMTFMAPDETASTEPGGEVFDLRDEIDAKMSSTVFVTAYIAEAREGDMLLREPLLELLTNERALLAADDAGALTPGSLDPRPFLVDAYDRETGVSYHGVLTFADAVDGYLRFVKGASLEQATDDDVKVAVSALLRSAFKFGLLDQLSVKAANEPRTVLGQEIDYWTSPALIQAVRADNEALGGASGFIGLATDEAGLNRERFARNVQEQLRGAERTYELWGLAIDQTLTANEQGKTAGAFIVLTVMAALVVVGASLRAYWPTALTAAGIGALMIWLKGLTALVGIKGGLVVELIVPIAMVSLGVDFAVHAARRYQEERHAGLGPADALRVGMAGVFGALLLAMLSDGIAFLSNIPSGIEAIVHFGFAAGIAVISSFTVLGIVLPAALMRIEEIRGVSSVRQEWPLWAQLLGSAGVTGLTGTGVIILVALSPPVGAGILFLTTLAFVAIPAVVLLKRRSTGDGTSTVAPTHHIIEGAWLSRMITALAARWLLVLPVAAAVTAASVVLALRLEPAFDVKDFFSSDSDLVIGLDKLDEHVGDRSGEGGIVFIQGNLASPEVLRAIDAFTGRLSANPYVGREEDGNASIIGRNVLDMVRLTMGSELGRSDVRGLTGVELTDVDGDGWPDTAEQVDAVFTFVSTHGVRLGDGTQVYTPDGVRTALYVPSDSSEGHIATLVVGIPGTREQSRIVEARAALLEDMAPLAEVPGVTKVGLTGSPFLRDAELTATVDNLRRSLPIAAVGALLLLLVAFRSLRYAVITVVPIGLVVAWMYAIMELAGFRLNFVSATIGAVSIGVGIDYSIHMTERFREEMAHSPTRLHALERAGRGTGVALLASAGSSVVGFAIMGFAPMPMFSTYGILTAVMIFLALTAALVVLPSLLMLVSKDNQGSALAPHAAAQPR